LYRNFSKLRFINPFPSFMAADHPHDPTAKPRRAFDESARSGPPRPNGRDCKRRQKAADMMRRENEIFEMRKLHYE
jgi:hypothetical protein